METQNHPSRSLTRIQSAIRSHPWAITEDALELICAIVEGHQTGNVPAIAKIKARMDDDDDDDQKSYSPYDITNGVAVIKVFGPIFPRSNLMTQFSGATSLEQLSSALQEAVNDPEVKAIILYFDSPGGSVSGLFECADLIWSIRQQTDKLVKAYATQACSAALLLAVQCDSFDCSVGATIGSLGIIAQVGSDDRMRKNRGEDNIIVRSSELKAPGGDQITPNQLASIRNTVNTYYGMFKSYVGRARPGADMSEIATGESWIGAKAVELGLCDSVKTLDDLVSNLSSQDVAN